jgi:iron(III) transport system ATP-binding protein
MQATQNNDAPRLSVQSLSRVYGSREVVRDVSLKVGAGQVACLLGPSGCGKSTTLRMIAGVDDPNGGVIRIDGREVFGSAHIQP